ncbi:type III secretion system inner membrane ring subunit SctD [Burkholderia sp. Bp8986]|uniref:type III secretion system inner membrane ring subunit SctD n=1 Tax=Burkholderia sp. Bp8986 TaxID=2184550 RepID=UPI000F5B51D7|nr:type III secretion system inner membrane ring subunit SctD [Burkholderia sp. Bp8986]RQS43263.1 EscD/YscD/HrpQ family type III secretion system inner membrane ring protein [Burkholderia sp. Bp8986]
MSSRFKLKLLNGPLARRELRLPVGEWRIGGPQSDFAVELDGGGEAILKITDTDIELLGAVPYWISGKSRSYPSGPLPLRVPIDIDGLVVMIGHAFDLLPEVKVPGRTSPQRLIILLLCLAVTTFITVGITVAAITITPPNFRYAPVGPKALSAIASKELGQKGVNIGYQQGGIVLSGACADRRALSKGIDRLLAKGIAVTDNVVCEDDLVRSVKSVLQLYGFTDVRVLPDINPGYVKIIGRVGDDPNWSQTAATLGTLPGLAGWRIEDAGTGLVQELTARLRTAGVLDKLSVFRSGEIVFVNGVLDSKQEDTVRSIISIFSDAHPGGPRVVYQAIPPNIPSDKIFPSPLASIGGDSRRAFAVLSNGQRYSVGDALPSGFRIESVHSDGVDVEYNGDFIHISVDTGG